MKITDHIKKANGKTLFSFELIPPRKGKSIQELYNNIDPLYHTIYYLDLVYNQVIKMISSLIIGIRNIKYKI